MNLPSVLHNYQLKIHLLWGLLALNIFCAVFAVFYSGLMIDDDIEHLRAAYFVSLGEVPYVDFFEHHHFLLWYLLAAVLKIVPHDALLVLFFGRLISLAVSAIGGYYIYKIVKNFIGGQFCALICLNLYFWGLGECSLSGLFNIKPDIYQRAGFFVGLYYLFCYFRYVKLRDLLKCGLVWCICFLFLQTTVFFVFPLVIPIIYFINKHPQKWKDFLIAAIVPVIIIASCAIALWHCDMWQTYFEQNWRLNSILAKIWLINPPQKIMIMADLLLFAFGSLIYLLYKKKWNIYLLSLSCCFIIEFLLQILTGGGENQRYFILLSIYAAMLGSLGITKAAKHYNSVIICFILGGLLYVVTAIMAIRSDLRISDDNKNVEFDNSIVFSAHTSFYWMHVVVVEGIHDVYFGHYHDYNINDVLRLSKPSSIIYDWETLYDLALTALQPDDSQKEILLNHKIDQSVLDTYRKISELMYIRN